jgi:hypothetical protein
MYCKNCGTEIEPGNDTCPSCGMCQNNYDRKAYYGREKRQEKKNAAVWISALVGILILGAAAVFYIHLSQQEKNPESIQEEVAEATEEENSAIQPETATGTDAGPTPEEMYAALKSDVSTAALIQSALSGIQEFGSEEETAYLSQVKGEVLILDQALLSENPSGVYSDMLDILGGELPVPEYTWNGASAFSFQVTEDDVIHVYITDSETPDKWEIYPNTCQEYDTSW